MKPFLALAFAALAAPAAAQGVHTEVHQKDGRITIIQSGDPSKARVRVDRKDDAVTVIQNSGSNSAVIVQQSGPEPRRR
jgi:hypothetical protein